MALGTSIFSAEWHTHHRGALVSGMTATVTVTRVLTEGKWTASSGDYSGGTSTVLYEGRADFDRIARPIRREFVEDAADNQMVQVKLPMDAFYNEADPAPTDLRFQSNDQVVITASGSSPMAVGEILFVKGWFPDSEDWCHVLHCNFNSKQGGS